MGISLPRRCNIDEARALLDETRLRSIVTLKVLRRFSSSMTLRLVKQGDDWALLSLLPIPLSDHWDKKGYSEAEFAAFIEGNADPCKSKVLDLLPQAYFVIKTGDEFLRKLLAMRPGATRATTFVSFTTSGNAELRSLNRDVRQSSSHDAAAWQLFTENGYEDDELGQFFNDGAQWFGLYADGTLASACFVFQNYGSVWEVGGVNTRAEFRRKGFGKAVVEAALDFLLGRGLIPRYQARWDNSASIRLAESCGLSEYMRVDHYFLHGTTR